MDKLDKMLNLALKILSIVYIVSKIITIWSG